MAFDKIQIPTTGAKITLQDGKLHVPDRPIVAFIEGDGTGPDIWAASQPVIDAAVAKAYGGRREIGLDGSVRWRESRMMSTTRLSGCRKRRCRRSTSISSP